MQQGQFETAVGDDDGEHSVIGFSNIDGHEVRVEMARDDRYDVFQIGRQTNEPKIDFLVNEYPDAVPNSRVSRFAFRIQVNRETFEARIYAAGYDKENKIFLGKNAKQWRMDDGTVDGLSTNGLWVLFHSFVASTREWREVSVTGKLYPCFDDRNQLTLKNHFANENNILEDKSIIDIGGKVLFWRSRQGEFQQVYFNRFNI